MSCLTTSGALIHDLSVLSLTNYSYLGQFTKRLSPNDEANNAKTSCGFSTPSAIGLYIGGLRIQPFLPLVCNLLILLSLFYSNAISIEV